MENVVFSPIDYAYIVQDVGFHKINIHRLFEPFSLFHCEYHTGNGCSAAIRVYYINIEVFNF
jgi:hypothetical protein